MNLRTAKTSTLLRLGLALFALRGVLQILLNHYGVSTNLADFVSGLLLGAGSVFLLTVAWRNGRNRRGESTDGCTKWH
jgi:hypothetical protein